jgi:CRISPR-associated protein Cas8b1/Cst1 subtype I-B
MNVELYRRYLEQYVKEAISSTSGSNTSIYEYLSSIRIGKYFVAHKEEKQRALTDAKQAFEAHRHWPLQIVLSHLGIKLDD